MAARSIASLSISFGLVSIPVKVYSATESAAAIRFKLMGSNGERVRQQYVTEAPVHEEAPRPVAVVAEPEPEPEPAFVPDPGVVRSKVVKFPSARHEAPSAPEPTALSSESAPIERSSMVKGYEYEKGRFVLFTPEELKALEAGSRTSIDILSFIPEAVVDPIFYDKAYFLAPDKRGGKPYALLLRAMRDTGRCALAKWAFRAKEYVVQIRAVSGGLVLQQLLYAEEVRSIADLNIEPVSVGEAELNLAKQLISQICAESYDPTAFVDEEKQRILDAVKQKLAGQAVALSPTRVQEGRVVDLLQALRASLNVTSDANSAQTVKQRSERKPAKRAPNKPPEKVTVKKIVRSKR